MRLKIRFTQHKAVIVLYLHSVDFPLRHSCWTRIQGSPTTNAFGKARQGVEGCGRGSKLLKQLPKGDGADILGADEAKTVKSFSRGRSLR